MNDLTYNEEPLVGMISKPISSMTEEELRAHVQNIRMLRQSAQTLRAEMAISRAVKSEAKEDKKTASLLMEF